jgi:Raf kinase inhibitor-like YbhB/YbcL family protein
MEGGANMINMNISSPSFELGKPIPVKFSCSGENISPELQWKGVPAAAKSLALIVDDPDAPMGTWTHWVIYNLPPNTSGLPEGIFTNLGTQGLNSSRRNAYMGPCPPPGKPHRYFFKIYATDLEPNLPEGLTADKLYSQLNSHILAAGEWMGTFSR